MIFSEQDIAALSVVCWCQYVQAGQLERIAGQREINNLLQLGFIKFNNKTNAMVLTSSGKDILQKARGYTIPQLTRSYHEMAVKRRLRQSQIAATAYGGGVDIFTVKLETLTAASSLFFSAISRGQGSNPWANTRIAAIAHLGDLFCAVHYVCPGIGKIALTDELAAFSNQTARFPGAKRAFLFAGKSYKDILTELEADTQTDTKLISYGGAYRCLHLPVHLLSCDDTGAVQLQIMAQPDYRTRLARAALKEEYQPPPPDISAWDAIYNGRPLVIAADMDLRRLDAAIQAARDRGLEQIAVAALEKQAKAVLIPRYQDTGQARVFALTKEAITEVTGRPPVPYTPPHTQFLTEKGDVVNAPPIRIPGKAGGQAGRKMRPLD